MKKTLSIVALLGILTIIGIQSAEAITWSNLNPFNWGKCNKCEKKIPESPCPTGYAAPCDHCNNVIPQSKPCDECDKLQNEMAK